MTLKIGDIIEFRGCTWNDGWEFGAPTVLYMGTKEYSELDAGIDNLIEEILIDVLDSDEPLKKEFSSTDLKVFKWRGWSPRGFARRKRAYHTRVIVKIKQGPHDGELEWDKILQEEQEGPFENEKSRSTR